MRFSAGWFKKLYPFARNREAEPSKEEPGSSREEMTADEEVVAEKPNLRMRLMGLFKREKAAVPIDEGNSGQGEPQNKLEVPQEVEASDDHLEQKDTEETPRKNLWTRLSAVFKRKSNEQSAAELADAAELFSWGEGGNPAAEPAKEKAEKDQLEDSAGQVDASPKLGFFARLIAGFQRKKKIAETVEDAKAKDKVVEQKGEEVSDSETPKRSLWTRLGSLFKRKSSEQPAADLDDATELISRGDGEPQVAKPGAGKSARAGKGKEETRGEESAVEGEEEGQPPLGYGAKISALVRTKKVWIPLLLVTIGSIVFVVSLQLSELRAREGTQMLELEKKNKRLQEENKKLQALKKKAVISPSKAPAAPSQHKPAGRADAARQDSSDDCTVNNKASAAEVLKRCIDNFNAIDQRG